MTFTNSALGKMPVQRNDEGDEKGRHHVVVRLAAARDTSSSEDS